MKRRSLHDSLIIACVACVGISALLVVWRATLEATPGTDSALPSQSTTPPDTRPPLIQEGLAAEPSPGGSEEHVPSQHLETVGETSAGLTGLGLELKGTVVTGFEGYNVAIIECLGKQGVYREGDRVGEVMIQKVLRNKAIVRVVDRDEVLVMDFQRDSTAIPATIQPEQDIQPSPSNADPSISLERAELLSSSEDVHGLMKSARLHPQMKGNKSAGFLVSSIKPGSLLAKMGLRNGDTIVGVNGEPITSAQQAMDFYKSLVEGEKIALKIKRRGHQQTLELEIE
ncbi:MAG: PDZ domain-containing protein [Deltaproteobacteria bacterium]|nr:PDZ domain-containing protein [Deltaproteobacteria bacterium]